MSWAPRPPKRQSDDDQHRDAIDDAVCPNTRLVSNRQEMWISFEKNPWKLNNDSPNRSGLDLTSDRPQKLHFLSMNALQSRLKPLSKPLCVLGFRWAPGELAVPNEIKLKAQVVHEV